MSKHTAVFAVAGVFVLGVVALNVSGKPSSIAGTWQVDTRHSAVQLITDGTTDFGKTKLDFTLGFGRVNGSLKIDDADPTKSSIVFRFYPANGMSPAIAENGKFLSQWLMNQANHTLVCFHSKTVQRTADGRLQATGDLTLTRVDRNVELDPTEAYSGTDIWTSDHPPRFARSHFRFRPPGRRWQRAERQSDRGVGIHERGPREFSRVSEGCSRYLLAARCSG